MASRTNATERNGGKTECRDSLKPDSAVGRELNWPEGQEGKRPCPKQGASEKIAVKKHQAFRLGRNDLGLRKIPTKSLMRLAGGPRELEVLWLRRKSGRPGQGPNGRTLHHPADAFGFQEFRLAEVIGHWTITLPDARKYCRDWFGRRRDGFRRRRRPPGPRGHLECPMAW